jgi:hypothetical protein
MVLLITADPQIREQVQRYAARAGAYLDHQSSITGPVRLRWGRSPLVLLGADLAHTVARARLRRLSNLVLLTDGRPRRETAIAATRVSPSYVADVRTGGGWLTSRLAETATVTLGRLHSSGYLLGYADRDAARRVGHLTPFQYTDERRSSTDAVYVSFGAAASGDCASGHASTLHRSNFRVLHRRYPNAWTDLVFSNITVLGAFACDLPPQAVDQLCALTGDPLLDSADLTALEQQEIRESWQQRVAQDVHTLLDAPAREAFAALPDAQREQLWWQTAADLGVQPEHTGYTVRWNYDRLVPAYAQRLIGHTRRAGDST